MIIIVRERKHFVYSRKFKHITNNQVEKFLKSLLHNSKIYSLKIHKRPYI